MANFVISMRYLYFILLIISIICAAIGLYKIGESHSSEADYQSPTNYIVLSVVSLIFTIGLLILLLTTPPNCDNMEGIAPINDVYRPDMPYYPSNNVNQPRASMPYQAEPEMDKPTFMEKYAPMLLEHGPSLLKELNPKWSQKLSKFTKGAL
ncbi:hypothetical protein CCP3SC1AL1_1100003 [Gammaproteobacteria bacterium]